MPPAYVKPYVKRQKNDAADAQATRRVETTQERLRQTAARKGGHHFG
jgi:hypothetical protein